MHVRRYDATFVERGNTRRCFDETFPNNIFRSGIETADSNVYIERVDGTVRRHCSCVQGRWRCWMAVSSTSRSVDARSAGGPGASTDWLNI